MLVNSISDVNSNFRGQRVQKQKITPAHIAAVTSNIHSSYIEQLEGLGLMNKSMLQRVRKAAAVEKARSTAKSVDTIADILLHPRYEIVQRDNGYYYQYENPYNFREKLDAYAPGPQKYSTPIFSREREYARALENIAQNGNYSDFRRAIKITNTALAEGIFDKHEKTLAKINRTTKLSFCTPKVGTYGTLERFSRYNAALFVDNTLLLPLKNKLFVPLLSMLEEKLKTAGKTIRI
ncbi:MAG: hypothetical protein K6A44_03785 [bacterium]|nr:hypothetical protein [bacterium]